MIDEIPGLPWEINTERERYLSPEVFMVDLGFMLLLNGLLSSLGFQMCAVYSENWEEFLGFDLRGTGHDPLQLQGDPWKSEAFAKNQVCLRPMVRPEDRL